MMVTFIEERITPIITSVYGDSVMSRALIAHLAPKISDGVFDSRGRQHSIMLTCWDWFSGGSTAEYVASKIEDVLQ